MRRRLLTVAAVASLTSTLCLATASGTTGQPHEEFQFGLDGTGANGIAGVVNLHAEGGYGLGLADGSGAHHVTDAGSILYTKGGALGEDIVVDSAGTGFATLSGDHAVHVLNPDGSEKRTLDLSFIDPSIQPTRMLLDSGAPDAAWTRVLYVMTTTDGIVEINPDDPNPPSFALSNYGLIPNINSGLLAVAPDHSLYWSAVGSNKVTRYTDEGIRMSSFLVTGNSDATNTVSIGGLTIDSAGTMFVSDTANFRIVLLHLDGTFVDQFGEPNPNAGFEPTSFVAGALDGPGPLGVDCRGALWVVDTDSSGNSRVVKFTRIAAPTGSCVAPPGTLVTGPNSNQAGVAAVDRADDVYVTSLGQVQKFDVTGHLVLSWGTAHPDLAATTPAMFGFPSDIGADPVSGDIWVASYRWPVWDANGNLIGAQSGDPKLLRFGPTGTLRAHITTPVGGTVFTSPSALVVRPSDGHVFVADSTSEIVQELDRNGAFVRSFTIAPLAGAEASTTPFVLALAFDSKGNLLASVRQRSGHATGPLGAYSWSNGGIEQFSPTAGGSPVQTLPVPQSYPTANPPALMAKLADGSMLWGGAPILPPAYGVTAPNSVLAVTSDLKPTHSILDSQLGLNGSDGFAVDCHGNVTVTDPGNARLLTLRFTTAHCIWKPTATTGAMTKHTSTSITVTASANPSAQVTKMRVLYGPTTSYGKATAWITLPSDNTVQTRSIIFSGLLAAHYYHYRVQVQNPSGTVIGADRIAKTL